MVNYIQTNLPVNIVFRLPHSQSADCQSLYYQNISKNWNISKIKILSGPILVKMLKVILRIFLHLLDKHFGRNHICHKIFNGNNVKISYSCTDNIKNVIGSYKKEIANLKFTTKWMVKHAVVGIKTIIH